MRRLANRLLFGRHVRRQHGSLQLLIGQVPDDPVRLASQGTAYSPVNLGAWRLRSNGHHYTDLYALPAAPPSKGAITAVTAPKRSVTMSRNLRPEIRRDLWV